MKKLLSLLLVLLLVSGCATATETPSETTDETTKETTKTTEVSATVYDTDMVIVGGGYSGLVAAVEASNQGVDVVVMEKAAYAGGTGAMTEGIFGINSEFQEAAGVEHYDEEELVAEELDYFNHRVDPVFWEEFISASGEMVDWLIENGVTIEKVDGYGDVGSMAKSSFHWWVDGVGANMTTVLEAKARENGVEFLLSTPGESLIQENGVVTGVIGTNTETNQTVQVNAKAVILATGGHSGNYDIIEEVNGYDMTFGAGFQTGSNGDGYLMAKEVGGRKSDTSFLLSEVYVYGYDSFGQEIASGALKQNLLYVNQEGKRFMDEGLSEVMKTLADNMVFAQPRAYSVFDQATIDLFMNEGTYVPFMWGPKGTILSNFQQQIDDAIENELGNVFKADTIEELAALMGVDPETLATTVETYNGYCATGVDEEFNKKADYLREVSTGPYYAVRQDQFVVRGVGALDTDKDCRVLGAGGVAVEGLYSAGSDGIQMYAGSYNFSNPGSLSGAVAYTGRNAAQHAIIDLGLTK